MQCLYNERARLIIGTACFGTSRCAHTWCRDPPARVSHCIAKTSRARLRLGSGSLTNAGLRTRPRRVAPKSPR